VKFLKFDGDLGDLEVSIFFLLLVKKDWLLDVDGSLFRDQFGWKVRRNEHIRLIYILHERSQRSVEEFHAKFVEIDG
jgi:hypothetical protein